MSKEITKAYILQELQDKFKLREFDPAAFLFDETVVPVYNVEPHLSMPQVHHIIKSITSGPDPYWFFTVPPTEKWILHRYNVIFMTGSYTVAGLMVYRPEAVDYIYIDLAAARSASYAHDLPKDIILDSNDAIYVYVDGYTSTGNLELRMDLTVEEIR